MAECEAQVDPGSVDITCEGGEIRGTCDAECTGRCAVAIEGSCSGTCEGSCEGTCSARNADGSCAGTCDGTCHGECVVDAQASCSGECRGGCSVEYREPYCTGTLRRPTASARCRASCDARIEASARCTPGETNISIDGGMDAASQARYAQVQAAIREGVSAILAIRTRVQRLSTAGAEIVRTAPEIPEAAATVSIGAVACATAAAATCAEAAASVSVSVEVSVSVSASASVE
jgi:modification target Cys-rich repeat protein